MAPLDRGAQCAVSLGQAGAGLGLQGLQPLLESRDDLARREQLDPGGGQLEREWEPVQAQTQPGDRVGVCIGELEVGPRGTCAIHEQSHRLDPPEVRRVERVGRVRKPERRDRVDPLCGNVQRRAAGDEQRQAGCTGEQLGERRCGFEHVLEVVQHERRTSAAQVGDQRLERLPAGPFVEIERAADRPGDEVRVADRRELDEHHSARKLRVQAGGRFDREPRLPRAARAGQAEESHVRVAQQRSDLAQFPAAADEGRGARSRSCKRPCRSRRGDVELRILSEDRPL